MTSQASARTVRLDDATRAQLDSLATASDRTISQLVRYALSTYFGPAGPPGMPTSTSPGDRDSANAGQLARHATLRLPPEMTAQVESYAVHHGSTFSDVVRHAVETWLDSDGPDALGAPAIIGGAT